MSIEKVANHAGVSTATVSRVLNNFPGVRAETARQVRLALEALQYHPNQLKRARRSGAGISRGAKDLGFRLLLDEVLDITKPLPLAMAREVDGVVVFISSVINSAETRSVLASIGHLTPAVWVMGGANGPVDVDHVSPD